MRPITNTQKITIAALLAAANIIFLIIMTAFPTIGFPLSFFLPLLSVLVFFFTNIKTYLLYVMTSLFLTILFIPNSIEAMTFFLIPSIFFGFAMGNLFRLRLSFVEHLYFLGILHIFNLSLTIFLSELFYQSSLLQLIYTLLQLPHLEAIHLFDGLILYIFGLIQVLMTLILISPLLERFKIVMRYEIRIPRYLIKLHVLTIGIALITIPFFPWFTLWMIGPITLLSVYLYFYYFLFPKSYSTFFLIAFLALFPFVYALFGLIYHDSLQVLAFLYISFPPIFIHFYKSINQNKKNVLI